MDIEYVDIVTGEFQLLIWFSNIEQYVPPLSGYAMLCGKVLRGRGGRWGLSLY